MKDWLSANFKKICSFVGWTIFAGVIWEFFRPIYSASISAAGQAGNFFVNLFYGMAAEISLLGFICFLANLAVGISLTSLGFSFYQTSKTIRGIKTLKREETRYERDITKSLRRAQFYSTTSFCLGVLLIFIFYIYILRPLQLKMIFERRMTTLRAVIPTEQIYKFNARWCLMRSKEDYLRLKADMDNIEEKYKADLERLSSGE